ncbi:zinc finger BED domain-containing protein RICESLEEPER 2-like [Heracleum sosnowskyi]|uniref:Zinc finger BED domain-containing protein RICESLEEPER 2-like n=1 Tax=Heracleum sosnowskyi TaxID=360622 RepID=A0AAD8ID85_9APIA|nr:zinc finger BED domain-containing protein RICESLEEPER 2-like [Heracleum sosnowskyi]
MFVLQIPKLHDTLHALFDLYKDKIPTYTVVCGSQAEITFQNQGLDVMKEFDALDCDQGTASDKSELDKYLEEKRLNRALDVHVLDYWSTNQFRFPNIALMARDVLTIPISTVASESAFSVGGRVLDQYRSCLAHNIVENLLCTRDWKFNEQEVYHNYPLEELTQDIMKVDITDHPDQDG